MEIAPDTRMGLVELSVSDLDRTLAYWQNRSACASSRARTAGPSSASTPLVRFVEEPGATSARGYTGLFHVALLVPDRPSLARFLAHVVRDGIEVTGLSDHGVSEAIYLHDPDNHGIEIYADRPKEAVGGPRRGDDDDDSARHRLTARRSRRSGATSTGCPSGTAVGHVHLCVGDVDEWSRSITASSGWA